LFGLPPHELLENIRVLYVVRHGIEHRIMTCLLADIEVIAADVASVAHNCRACHNAVLIGRVGGDLVQVLLILVHLYLLPFAL
jgi:hypothetical protein